MKINPLVCLFLFVFSAPVVPAAEDAPDTGDERAWLAFPDGLVGTADPLRFLIEGAQASLRQRSDPESREAWLARVPALKRDLARGLGLAPLPPRTPLNARVTGRAQRAFYRVENVVYESRPGFYVSANVYIPEGIELPAPAVVVAAGHAMDHGKNHDLYQLGQLSLVKQGMIVLAFDPIGQGERKLPGFAHDLGYGSLLVGQTNEGRIVWDAIRAVDYLVSRADVDASRIGIAGNSGGGELVFYAMPLDERIKAGASFCFVCSYDQWIEKGGNHCICNHLPGITRKMEQFEIIGLNAPRAFLAGNGTEDKIFPIDGVRDTIRRAGAIYALHGAPDHIDAVEAPLPHGWSQPLREAGAGWLSHWLTGQERKEAIPETGIVAEAPDSPDLKAFKSGSMPEGAETVITLNQQLAREQIGTYAAAPSDSKAWELRAPQWREELWAIMGGRPKPFEPTARTVNIFEWEGLRVEVLALMVEPGFEIGATLATPVDGAASDVASLFVGGFESRGAALRDGRAAAAARNGTVLVIDPRGSGESARNLNQLVSGGIVMGRALFAQQVWDVVQAARWLSHRNGAQVTVQANGEGDGALLALYAAALEAPFERLELQNLLASYRYYLENDQPQSILLSLPSVLDVADVPQIIALAVAAPIHIDGLIGFGKARLAGELSERELAYPRAVAALTGRQEGLKLE
ncbi:MAG: acetylxylan esterase [Candidatus Hydrogenedentes bacterium]|nr:acetylxylan esterase [Candidatus Hydrogenedentota bacterium]